MLTNMNNKSRIASAALALYCVAIAILCSFQTSAFSLITPPQPWMMAEMGYARRGWLSGHGLIEHEYRWTSPYITYGFSEEFREDFGDAGILEIKKAFSIITLPHSNNIDLGDHPEMSYSFNHTATKQNIRCLKSIAASCILEQLGVGNPLHALFAFRSVKPGFGYLDEGDQNVGWFRSFGLLSNSWSVIYSRNFDPYSLLPRSYINGNLFSFKMDERLGYPRVELLNVDPGLTRFGVASFQALPGYFITSLSRDDVGALKQIISPDNINIESLPSDVVSADGSFLPSSVALRRGVGLYRFVEMGRNASGDWLPANLPFEDVIVVSGKNQTNQLRRIVREPDILFTSHRVKVPSTSGLVFHLPLDYHPFNVRPNTNTGVFVAAVETNLSVQKPSFSFVKGIRKQGLRFEGSGYVGRILRAGEESPTASDFTVSVWMRGTNIPSANSWWRILHQGSENPWIGRGFGLVMQPEGSDLRGKVTFEVYNNSFSESTRFNSYASSRVLSDGKWHHLLGVFRGGFSSFYVDGQLNGSGANAFTTISNRAPVTVGNTLTASNGSFRGDVDEVRIYRRALTAQEARQLYLLESGEIQYAVNRSDTSRWKNFAAENGLPGQQGPGVLALGSVISFANNPEDLHEPDNALTVVDDVDRVLPWNNPTGASWGAFDGSTNVPRRLETPKLIARKMLAGLQGYWSFDNDGADYFGRNRLFPEGGAVVAEQGFVGGCFLFPPTGGSLVNLSADIAGRLSGDFTISLWARHIDLLSDPSSGKPPIQEILEIGPNRRIVLKVNVAVEPPGLLVPGIGLSVNTSGGIRDVRGYQLPPINKWYHCAVTYSNQSFSIYVDGLRVGGSSEIPPVELTRVPSTMASTLRIGGASGSQIRGFIDEVSVWNRALSSDEVRRLSMLSPTILEMSSGVSIHKISSSNKMAVRAVTPFGGPLTILKSDNLVDWWTLRRETDGSGSSYVEEEVSSMGFYRVDYGR